MTSDSAKLELQLLLLHAVVESKDAELLKLKAQNRWLMQQNQGLRAQIDISEGVK